MSHWLKVSRGTASRRPDRRGDLPPHSCPCGDEDRPGWTCSECGGVAVPWMTDEEFASYCRDNPLDDVPELSTSPIMLPPTKED